MPASIIEAVDQLLVAMAGFNAGIYTGLDCARLVEKLSVAEKTCAAVRLLAAERAVTCKAFEEKGFSDGADWLATQSGTTPGQAKRNLNTAGRLGDKTKDALLAGKLSLDQAEEITNVANQVPGSEEELVDLAPTTDLSHLRQEARDRLLEAMDRNDLHRQQQKARRVHTGRNRLGMVCGGFELPPEVGLPFLRRLELRAHKLRNAAKQRAKDDPTFEVEGWDAYAADALIEMINQDGIGARSGQVELSIVCDLGAWRRGHTHEGEPCHIVDGGPIRVELAKQLTKDAFLNAVLHDGVDILTLARFGRHIPAHLRAALDIGDPPDFSGKKCADCGKRHSLQLDHVNPVANGGPTSLDNLKPAATTTTNAKPTKTAKPVYSNHVQRQKTPARIHRRLHRHRNPLSRRLSAPYQLQERW